MTDPQETIVADNYTLLKNQGEDHARLSHSKAEIKAMIKQKEIKIVELSKSVESRRAEMRKLSKEVNLIIQKNSKKQQKQGPSNWSSQLVTQKLKNLHGQLQSAYKKNEDIKNQISQIKQDQPEQIVKQMQRNRAKMAMLQKQQKKIRNNKTLLMEQLEGNKTRIQELRENSCLIDLENREKEYEEVKKDCYQTEKDFRIVSAEFLQVNSYYYEMKGAVEKEVIEEKEQPFVDQKEVLQLISQINLLADQRRIIEKENDIRKKQGYRNIAQFQKKIRQRQSLIRQLQNDILRAGLESKRVTTYATEPRKTHLSTKKQIKKLNPEVKPEKKQKIVNKVYMMQKEEQKNIVVGPWNSEGGIISSDRGQKLQSSVQRVKKLTFLLVKQDLVGIRSLYADKGRSLIDGRTLLPEGIHSYTQIQISLDQVATIEYSSRNSPIYLRFITHEGTYKQIGSKDLTQSTQRMSLQHYHIKWIEVQLTEQLQALRINLQQKPLQQKTIAEQTPERNLLTQRSFSNSSIGPKRVILKGRSLSKLKSQQIIDHRLMLSRHKMV